MIVLSLSEPAFDNPETSVQADQQYKVDIKSDLAQTVMPKVKFTAALKRFFPSLQETVVEGTSVFEVVAALEQKHPGLSTYLVDDAGKLRQHVNVFIKNELIQDRDKLSDAVHENDEMFIFQALSGG